MITNAYNETPLHLAEDAAIQRMLLKSGADPTVVDDFGQVALSQ